MVYINICVCLYIGYRRISVETDSRHVAIGKFLKKVGFQFEAILRKHKIMLERNCDTSVYALLNSEWPDVEIRAKRYLGLPLTSTVKAANII